MPLTMRWILVLAVVMVGGLGCRKAPGTDGRPSSDTHIETDCVDGVDNDGDGWVDCMDPDCHYGEDDRCAVGGIVMQSNPSDDVDLLFVIDNSASMAEEQLRLRQGFPALLTAMREPHGGLPNLHIGVTTGDLGVGASGFADCSVHGDSGRLLRGACVNPSGASYIVDVAPQDCSVTRASDGQCVSHDCTAASCVHEPGAELVVNSETGCPRCRNYADQSLAEVFDCLADVGTSGCELQQPLKATELALLPGVSQGFLRIESRLGLVVVTDSDDCSARSIQLFDPTPFPESWVGPLTLFRCFHWGVECDPVDVWPEWPGYRESRVGCMPRRDDDALLFSIGEISSAIDLQKSLFLVSPLMIAGQPVQPGRDFGYDAAIDFDAQQGPALLDVCSAEGSSAAPAIRLSAWMVKRHRFEDWESWASTSVCDADYSPSLASLGRHLGQGQGPSCLETPPRGCPDVGAEFGTPQAPRACAANARCLPICWVGDLGFHDGGSLFDEGGFPPCLEILADGRRVEGNTDASLAYAQGRPPRRDADLPVEACWYLTYNASCSQSNFAEMVVARRQDALPELFTYVHCMPLPPEELSCQDGVDNDQDCLTDAEEPCCADQLNCM